MAFVDEKALYAALTSGNIRRRPVEDISRILSGEWPRGLINPEVKDEFTARRGQTG